MKVLAYQTDSGLVQIIIPNYERGLDVEDIKGNYPSDSIVLEKDSMPNKIFLSTMKIDNGALTIDLPKAKTIAHGIRREKRTEYMKDNIALIQEDFIGIPLKQGQSAAQAKIDNANYKTNIDDAMQVAIDAATSEAEILAALGM